MPPTIKDHGLTCKELVEIVTDYLEGTLSPSDQKRFSEHLALCDGCQAYLQQVRVIVATLGRLNEQLISSEAREKLLRAFRNWKA